MKTFVSILLVIVGVPALAQGPSVDSISIGDVTRQVRLALGTPKEAVLSSLREFSVEETSGDFMVSLKNAPGSFPYAIISFKNGRLSSVSKSWCCWNDDSGVAVVRGIYGAISSFGGSARACTITSFDTPSPEMDKRGLDIVCGRREVQIFTNRWTYGSKSGEGAEW